MTGYGKGICSLDGREMTVELKSVNHRYLDPNLRIPRNLGFLEDDIRRLLTENISRGHIEIYASYRNTREDSRVIEVDWTLVRAYTDAMVLLQHTLSERELSLKMVDDSSLRSIISMPDVLTVVEKEDDRDAVREVLRGAMLNAIEELISMREGEGRRLLVDFEEKAASIDGLKAAIEDRMPELINTYRSKLEGRVRELLGDVKIDQDRLLTEVAMLADRSAIDEELTRLTSHLQQFRILIHSAQPVGRKLDFIVQEMNREINTIGSKAGDLAIINKVVELKSELEKIREQVQNIE